MKQKTLIAALCAGCSILPAAAQTRIARRGFNLNVDTNNAEHCSDIKARSTNGEVVQTAETFALQRGEAPILEVDDSAGRASMQVRGWDRSDYSIEACKIAVADDRGAAEQLVRGMNIMRSAGRIVTSAPNSDSGSWQVYFLMRVPRDANLDLHTTNGPISVEGVNGNIKVRTTNGPLSVKNAGGRVDAQTTNGPISFHGNGGEVTLNAQNGPISVNLEGDRWNGTKLEAKTQNGPVSLSVPETFVSGIRLESSAHSPLSCNLGACRNAWTDARSDHRVLQMNGSQDVIRLTTGNGPVSVHGPKQGRGII